VTTYHKDKSTEIHNGDCLEVLRTLPDSSVDACVTDPPYGLAFMGKKWDYDVPSSEVWQECLRVLKPGGHLLAFAGTRTQHRMAVRIEDAGFEIRDMIAWVYGSGFPKSLDVSKAIDKVNGETDRALRFCAWFRTIGVSRKDATDAMIRDGHISANGTMAGHYYATSISGQPAIPTIAIWQTLRPLCVEVPEWIDRLIERIEAEREVVGRKTAGIANPDDRDRHTIGGSASVAVNITAPATEAAKQWQGWGTALKPALEPITVARKPFPGTVAENVLQHGTGAINVDGCRVGMMTQAEVNRSGMRTTVDGWGFACETWNGREPQGRWPANLIHDGSEEVVGLFPDDGEASAARFFYCAKADASERRNSKHPTIKPVALMRYLVRLVCPAGGVVLDPFAGSGTTIEAARLEHCRAIGIEREAEYCADILERLRQGVLF